MHPEMWAPLLCTLQWPGLRSNKPRVWLWGHEMGRLQWACLGGIGLWQQDPALCGQGQHSVCLITLPWIWKPSMPRQFIANEAKLDRLSLLFLPCLILLSWATCRSSSCPKGKLGYLNQGFSALTLLTFLSWGTVLCSLSGIPGLYPLHSSSSSYPPSPPAKTWPSQMFPDVAPGSKTVLGWEPPT